MLGLAPLLTLKRCLVVALSSPCQVVRSLNEALEVTDGRASLNQKDWARVRKMVARGEDSVTIDGTFVREKLAAVVGDEDLGRFVL